MLEDLLIRNIREKREIKNIPETFVKEKIRDYFLTNGDVRKRLEKEFDEKGESGIEKNKVFKEVVKRIREEIGIVYSSFLTKDHSKKEKILESGDMQRLLFLHKSSRERTEFYKEIYERIFTWHKPKKIADLACGYNPLSYPIMTDTLGYSPEYFACDLNPEDMEFLQEFFNRSDFPAKAKAYDLLDQKFLQDPDLISSDMVFLFKTLDSLEHVKKDISKKLLERLPQKKIVISFSTRSLVSGKMFRKERRNWLFNFITKKGWDHKTFEVENEMFILLTKSQNR